MNRFNNIAPFNKFALCKTQSGLCSIQAYGSEIKQIYDIPSP